GRVADAHKIMELMEESSSSSFGHGKTENAKKIYDQMIQEGSIPSILVIVTLIRGLCEETMVREAFAIMDQMLSIGYVPDASTLNPLVNTLCEEAKAGSALKGFKLLQVMKNKGVIPNVVVCNTLIHALCKNGKLGIGRARSLISEMVVPNDVTFNILITAYCKQDNIVQALVMLEKCFHLGFVPDVITITKVLEILCRNDRVAEAVEVLERVEMKGGKIDVVAYNTLVKGFCNLRKPKAACRFLKEMELKGCLPNVDTYNALISGFCESGLLGSALDMFYDMKTVGITCETLKLDTKSRTLTTFRSIRAHPNPRTMMIKISSSGGDPIEVGISSSSWWAMSKRRKTQSLWMRAL
nr:hypothetical protein [Tanacetum cinerariifolium]